MGFAHRRGAKPYEEGRSPTKERCSPSKKGAAYRRREKEKALKGVIKKT